MNNPMTPEEISELNHKTFEIWKRVHEDIWLSKDNLFEQWKKTHTYSHFGEVIEEEKIPTIHIDYNEGDEIPNFALTPLHDSRLGKPFVDDRTW